MIRWSYMGGLCFILTQMRDNASIIVLLVFIRKEIVNRILQCKISRQSNPGYCELGCYEVRIRYYGALSTTTRRKFGWINKKNKEAPKNVGIVDDEDSEFHKVKKKNWARLITYLKTLIFVHVHRLVGNIQQHSGEFYEH